MDFKERFISIKQGETVAIVGHTGAGKTTIISLLSRFYDIQKGEILIDGINIQHVAPADLRKHIGVVLQDVFLFSGDIKNNISLGNEQIPLERIKAAARMVGANKFIEELNGGYDGIVRERGATLSGGQKQLLSFARALAYNPRILVLDESHIERGYGNRTAGTKSHTESAQRANVHRHCAPAFYNTESGQDSCHA